MGGRVENYDFVFIKCIFDIFFQRKHNIIKNKCTFPLNFVLY